MQYVKKYARLPQHRDDLPIFENLIWLNLLLRNTQRIVKMLHLMQVILERLQNDPMTSCRTISKAMGQRSVFKA